ncbi:MAG: response regulator [Candidatus Omnitrophota bacterium]
MPEKTTVLVVDDEVNICSTLAKILELKGYEVAQAESGSSAVQMFRNRAFDVVLMDIRMPGMNGVEACKEMKKIKPETAVILMTAFTMDEILHEALREGAYAVVHKPLDMDTVTNMIEKARDGLFITVVDDDREISRVMKFHLEKKGYSVTTCCSPQEAITVAKGRRQDIFFIDIRLPSLNGLETYLELKKIDPNIVAVLMTAHRGEADELIRRAIKQGVYTCLYKPFDMKQVIDVVGEINIGRHKA